MLQTVLLLLIILEAPCSASLANHMQGQWCMYWIIFDPYLHSLPPFPQLQVAASHQCEICLWGRRWNLLLLLLKTTQTNFNFIQVLSTLYIFNGLVMEWGKCIRVANKCSDSFIMKLTLRLMTASHTCSMKLSCRGRRCCYFWMHINQYIQHLNMCHQWWEFKCDRDDW